MSAFSRAFDALKGLTNYETMVRPPYGSREMNLPRTRALLRAIGRPEARFPILQVGGTKGKGTASTALARILEAEGLRTGLYTSPHLFSVRERIAVNGAWIAEREFAAGVERILPEVEPLRGTARCPTFFELMTALALLHFARSDVAAAVLEVGLGGRLDATSAVRPLASLVTHVGLDHQAVLGRTKARIAAEKAGVAKRGVPLVSGVATATPAGRVIAAAAARAGAPLLVAGRDFRIRTGKPERRDGRSRTPVVLLGPDGRTRRLAIGMLGRDLARNGALAAATLLVPAVRRRLPVSDEAIERGLAGLFVPGRIQIVAEKPWLVVDGAHNPDSAESLRRTLLEALPFRRAFVVLGGGIDKQVATTARILLSLAPRVRLLFTRPASHPRADDPEKLAREFPKSRAYPDLAAALAAARSEAAPADLVAVTGSLYLAGEALAMLGETPAS